MRGPALQCAVRSAQSDHPSPTGDYRKGVGTPTLPRVPRWLRVTADEDEQEQPETTRRERRMPPGGLTDDGSAGAGRI